MSKRQRPTVAKLPIYAFASPPSPPAAPTFQQVVERATAACGRGEWVEAERLCRAVLGVRADYFDALHLLGLVAAATGRAREATEILTRALAVDPGHALAHYNLGIVFSGIGDDAAALACYDRAIGLNPDLADAHYNRGNLLLVLRRPDEALASYERTLTLKPEHAVAWSNRGATLSLLGRNDEALASYERALALAPDSVDAHCNRSSTLMALKRYAEARESMERALAIQPGYDFLEGDCLHARMRVCDWSDFSKRCEHLLLRVERGERAASPFVVLSVTDSPSLQRRAAETWVRARCPPNPVLPPLVRYARHDRIRVGYFSSDFCDHPVAVLTARLYEIHDRSRFEIVAFSSGPDTGDAMRRRLASAFDRFLDVQGESDLAVARRAREMEIDIAIDLGGFTQGSRPGVLALRAAPVQAGFLGYLGTMGAEYVDYLIADRTLIPEASRSHYSERIVALPSYQPNDATRPVADRHFTRGELGLPQSGFVFCCFNNSYKITPEVFDSWMRILQGVEGSVLLLYAGDPHVEANLRKEAAARGVDAMRLIFGERLPAQDYLARYRAADLALDTFPYNAGTTASDALWAGVPLVTLGGRKPCRPRGGKRAPCRRVVRTRHDHPGRLRSARGPARDGPGTAGRRPAQARPQPPDGTPVRFRAVRQAPRGRLHADVRAASGGRASGAHRRAGLKLRRNAGPSRFVDARQLSPHGCAVVGAFEEAVVPLEVEQRARRNCDDGPAAGRAVRCSLRRCRSHGFGTRRMARGHVVGHCAGASESERGLLAQAPVFVVETRRIELPTFALRTRRSPS